MWKGRSLGDALGSKSGALGDDTACDRTYTRMERSFRNRPIAGRDQARGLMSKECGDARPECDVIAETRVLAMPDGALPAYLARPIDRSESPAVVLLHHRDGWDRSSREIARRLAASGLTCVMPNLHHRIAPDRDPENAAAVVMEAGGVDDDDVVEHARAALHYIREQPFNDGVVACLGFCSGGRQAFLAACRLDFEATVVCYGPRINGTAESSEAPAPPLSHADRLTGELLLLFGEQDPIASPSDADEIAQELDRLGKRYHVSVYTGVGHAFLAADRDRYAPDAAVLAWTEILDWLRGQVEGHRRNSGGSAR